MAIWHRQPSAESSRTSRKRRAQRKQADLKQNLRHTQVESLERRQLFAVSPQLVAIVPNVGDLLQSGDVLDQAPRELTFRFDESQRINEASAQRGGVQVIRSVDGIFGNGNDINVTPNVANKIGFIGIGDRPNEVVVRFTDHLPDDLYQIRIVGAGANALTNVEGLPFNNGQDRTVAFELDLGPQVIAVVPQPITRQPGGALAQQRNQIDVYFNDDDLNRQAAENPEFYQLIRTRKTANNLDDGAPFQPTSAVYDAVANKVTLTFASDLAALDSTETVYRLRLGNRYSAPLAPIVRNQAQTGDAADTFIGAINVNQQIGAPALGNRSAIFQGEIEQVRPYDLELPGSNDEPGHRDVVARDFPLTEVRRGVDSPHVEETDSVPTFSMGTVTISGGIVTLNGAQSGLLGAPVTPAVWPAWAAGGEIIVNGTRFRIESRDSATQLTLENRTVNVPAGSIYTLKQYGVETFYYSFKTIYGTDPQNNPLSNLMSPTQKQRAREAFEYYAKYLGVQFVEVNEAHTVPPTDAELFVVALGDLRSIEPQVQAGPGNALVLASRERNLTVVDAAEDWGNSEPGGAYFRAVMQGIGQLMGMGHAFDLPATTIMGDTELTTPDAMFPGEQDIVHGRNTHRPESTDIDVYRFSLDQAGIFSAEVAAERLRNSSLLDSVLWVYNSSGELIARNDDYYSEDSYVELELQPGDYYVAVTSTGMSEIDPSIAHSGFGGTTEGDYELRLGFKPIAKPNPTANDGIVDNDGQLTLLDGDMDGAPGGEYNFWFAVASAANTFIVDKSAPAGGNGSLATPFNTIQAAFAAATARNSDGNASNDVTVVRVVGNGGADGNLATVGDNLAYEIGFDALGQPLADGFEMQVPRGVTVMVDAGAIFKLRRANIDVGSKSQGVDFSQGHLQVLGTPTQSVFFTSYNNEQIGRDTFNLPTTPVAGDWGGIVFRNELDFDERRLVLENEGVFINYVNHADFTYGGGDVVVNGIQASFNPVQLNEARPNISFNRMRNSAGAPIGADPNSFKDNLVNDVLLNDLRRPHPTPGQQVRFATDYRRIGPEIYFNRLTDNTINGLFVRVDTLAGQILDRLEVAARFNDTDIVHVLSEHLVIQGTPGGAFNPTFIQGTIGANQGVVTVSGTILPTWVTSGTLVTVRGNSQGGNSQGTVTIANGVALIRGGTWPRWAPGAELTIGGITYAIASRESNSQVTLTDRTVNIPIPAAFAIQNTFEIKSRESDTQVTLTNGNVVIDPGQAFIMHGRLAQEDARLQIDPGIVVKLDSARIETEIGAQLIAEGQPNNRVIFTSLLDDRFGAGGTFDTAGRDLPVFNQGTITVASGVVTLTGGIWPVWAAGAELIINGVTYDVLTRDSDTQLTLTDPSVNILLPTAFRLQSLAAPAAGDWGGLYFGPLSSGSVDNALITHAGGVTPIEGGFASFNAVEIQQAEVRLTNSVLEENANGVVTRRTNQTNQRFSNDDATVYIRGAQPTIVNNVFRDNAGAAIAAAANAFNSDLINDWGRSSGALGRTGDFVGNYGPVIRQNRLGNNRINGMVVRGGTLTSQSIWDDTDIVHVVNGEIIVPNHHTYSGLRLQSDTSQSLVVKFSGATSGLTASGSPLDIDDRIGGAVQIIGQPGHPVVLTSLFDNTVGAGLDPEGRPQNNTANVTPPTIIEFAPELPVGNLIDNDIPRPSLGHIEYDMLTGASANTGGFTAVGASGTRFINQDFIDRLLNFVDVGPTGQAVNLANTTVTQAATQIAPDVVVSTGTFQGENGIVQWRAESRIAQGSDTLETTFTFSSSNNLLPLGQLRFINFFDQDIGVADNDVMFPAGAPGSENFKVFVIDTVEQMGFGQGGVYAPGAGLVNARWEGWAADTGADIETAVTGAGLPFNGSGNIDLTALPAANLPNFGNVFGPGDANTAQAWSVDPLARTATVTTRLQFVPALPQVPRAGDWRSVRLDQFSNDRNAAVVNEREQAAGNGTPSTAQPLGELAPNERGGDENRRLAFEVHGVIDEKADRDVYTFLGRAGTEVWLDLDRTTPALNAVIELIDADGNVLARSNESTLRDQVGFAGTRVYDLQRDVFNGQDLYTTNVHDAGMRLILPGPDGTQQRYYVRVRSTTDAGGQAESRGGYQLQVRLRELDEIPGSTVQFADIRYATNGIEILGMPGHSPLLGESAETTADNNTRANAQDLGNVLTVDRGAISVAGSLSDYNDVDWYKIVLDWDKIDDYPDGTGIRHDDFASLIFDIDFASGVGRPDTSLALFDETGTLIYVAQNSGIEDDQRAPDLASEIGEVQRGSFGPNDPYLGPVMLRENAGETYYIAVSSDALRPDAWKNNPLARIEPSPAQDRLIDDRVGSSFVPLYTNEERQAPGLFFGQRPLNTYADAYQLGDVVMFVHDGERLYTIDPYTGGWDTDIERTRVGGLVSYGDLAMRTDGRLIGIIDSAFDVNLLGTTVDIDTGFATGNAVGDDGIERGAVYPAITVRDVGNNQRILYAVSTGNLLYLYNADTGGPDPDLTGTDNEAEFPPMQLTETDQVTGIAWVGPQLYGVTDTGKLIEIDFSIGNPIAQTTTIATLTKPDPLDPTLMVPIPFSGLSRGPTNVESAVFGALGPYAQMLFASDSDGGLHAVDTTGVMQNVLAGGRASVETGLPGLTGLAFSSLDYNLWHITDRQGNADGRGYYPTPDGYRGDVRVLGGNGYYFGLEQDKGQLGARLYDTNPGVFGTYNLPGGAHGGLTTDNFSLVGYDFDDAPTLYFNYFAQHDSDATDNPNNTALDSFRAYISNNGADWTGLAQTPVPERLPDTLGGGVGLANDVGGWRQARIDLSEFAGLDNLRIRFDFNTSGGRDIGFTQFGGEVLAAKPGAELLDGQFIVVDHVDAGPTTFEFDMGFSLMVPNAAAEFIADGETFTIDTTPPSGPLTFEFDKAGNGVAAGNLPIIIGPTSTAEQIARAIEAAIIASGNAAITPRVADGITLSHLGDVVVSLEGVTSATQASPAGTPGLRLRGDAPGTVTQVGAVPVPIHAAMTAEEVAQAIAATMDSYFIVTVAAGVDLPGVFQSAKVDRDAIYIMQPSTALTAGTGGFLQVINPGPLTYSSLLPGDQFILGQRARAHASKNNNFEGVILDDFMLGLAERGEVMTNVNEGADDIPAVQRKPPGQVLEGAYQLEIRRGPDYGFPLFDVRDDGTILYGLDYTRGWDSNDRFSDGVVFTAPSPSTIAPGSTFTVDDGLNTVVFEFDLAGDGSVAPGRVPVDISTAQTAIDVARAAGQAINANPLLASVADWDASINLLGEQAGSPHLVLSRVAEFRSSLLPVQVDSVVADTIDLTMLDPANIPEGTYITIDDGQRRIHFEFDTNGFSDVPQRGGFTLLFPQLVDISTATTATDVAAALVQTIMFTDIEFVTKTTFPGKVPPGSFVFPATTASAEHHVGTPRVTLRDVVDFVVTVPPRINVFGFPGLAPSVLPPGGVALSITTGESGDSNPVRDQGQIVIHSNSVSNSAQFGIVYDATPRDASGSLPHPGAVRNLVEFNAQRLVRGAAITNNTVVGNASGGILVSGDTANDPQAPLPVVRVYNNTIFGGPAPVGVGIRVNENSSPTLLNNVVSNLTTGIEVDATSATTVVGGTVFHRNVTNTVGTGLGTFPMVVPNSQEVFVDPANGNFYPSAGSQVIDSSIETLQERPALANVMTAIGYSTSPLLAPDRDQLGQLRVNDPSVPSPPGLGGNVFKDRGAIDRADFAGPTAAVIQPPDNDPTGRDLDPAPNRLLVVGAGAALSFDIQLVDGVQPADPQFGSGVDDRTVDSSKFTIRRGNQVLVEGLDYIFSYDATNNIARFIPTQGIWTAGRIYEIELNNNAATGIKDLAGNALRPNESATGRTRFFIELAPVDFGDAPDDLPQVRDFPTRFVDGGAYHRIVTGIQLGGTITAEADGQPSLAANTDAGDDGVQVSGPFIPGEQTQIIVTASTAGRLDAWIDFNGNGNWEAAEQVFTSRNLVAGPNNLTVNVPLGALFGDSYARFRFSTAGGLAPTGAANDGEVEDYRIQISPLVSYTLDLKYSNNRELFRDAAGRYVVSPGLEVVAEVYVDDLRSVGATGVQQAFADLVYDNDLFDWDAVPLEFGPGITGSGTIDEPNRQVDEAGGTAAAPPANGDRQLLFRVRGRVKTLAEVPDLGSRTFTIGLNQADDRPAHDTKVFGNASPILASYEAEPLVVTLTPWQNPINPMDVNRNGFITGLDALIVINRLNSVGPGPLQNPPTTEFPPPFYDVDGNGAVTARDAIIIINALNSGQGGPVFVPASDEPVVVRQSVSAASVAAGAPVAASFDVTPLAVSVASSGSTAVAPAASAMVAEHRANGQLAQETALADLFAGGDDDEPVAVRVYQAQQAVDDLAASVADDDRWVAPAAHYGDDPTSLAVGRGRAADLEGVLEALGLDTKSRKKKLALHGASRS